MQRLLLLLTVFTTGMLLLMESSGMIEVFIGWEVIGVCSLLLIG